MSSPTRVIQHKKTKSRMLRSVSSRRSTPDSKAIINMRNRMGTADKTGCSVVAVGASAGGLDAFTKLLHGLPNDIGMAFVFIQHLDPKHHSILSDLLAKATSIPVVEASNRMWVEPNHVYIMPPNVNMGILRGRLQLTLRKDTSGLHLPIDFFM